MPEGVIYKNRADAEAYAKEVGGIIEEVDEEPKDGVSDGFKVVSPSYRHKGPDPGDLEDPATRQDLADYRAELGRRNMDAEKPSGEAVQFMGDAYVPPDEEGLGYMRHGGMKFKKRGAIKYSTGGAVKGKGFAGTF
jgi:hypothetical protein